ncbi:hypothetical protein [Xanthobacter autotrophicus]|uniref:hypothetical protein n=1 Tax=Xanthobacter autotrophicus TaxID=280 RepID=UPI0037298F75
MTKSFVLRAGERGHDVIYSDGNASSYVAGHPGSRVTRESSFNFHQYQAGRPGFGTLRVFGDGKLSSNVAELGRRDSFGVSGIEEITIEAADNTDVFFVETVMIDDARITAWEKEHGEDVRH